MASLLDYSAGKISGAAIKGAGYAGAIRYITDRNSLGTKHTSPSEYRDHVVNGLRDWLVYEVGTNDPLGGFSGGVNAAKRALDGANYIGYPSDRHIFFCFDRHATVSELPAWQSYLDGAASVLGVGRTGAYGFSEAIDAARGHASAFWQCGSRSVVRSFTNFYQRNDGTTVVGGITCDINDVLVSLENDVAITDDDANKIAGRTWYNWIWSWKNKDGSTGGLNASQVLAKLDNQELDAIARITELKAALAALQTKVDGLSSPTVDIDVLVTKMAPSVADAIKDGLAAAVLAELKAHPLAPS
jgi:hypothetical protein